MIQYFEKNGLQRNENHLRRKEYLLFGDDIQEQTSTFVKQMSITQKESGNLVNQKNGIEIKLKVLEENLKNLEKEKVKLKCIITKKDQLINKLDGELESVNEDYDNEKLNYANKFDEMNKSLKDLTLLFKNKKQEVEILKTNKADTQVECKNMLKILLERDNQILELKIKVKEYDKKVNEMQKEANKILKNKMEENFCNAIEEKDREILQLNRLLNQAHFNNNYLSNNDSKE